LDFISFPRRTISNTAICAYPGTYKNAETGVDFEYNGHVWIGCRNTNTIFKLNGGTGDILASYGPFDGKNGSFDVQPYGFVLDQKEKNRLWIAGKDGDSAVYWLDTTNGVCPFTIVGQKGHVVPTTLSNYQLIIGT
jgi:hypothetical protein